MKKLGYLFIAMILISLTCCKKNKIEKKACSEGSIFIQYNDTSIVYMPNIFTPNGDGMNDMLCVRGELQSLHLTIKDGVKKYLKRIASLNAGMEDSKAKSRRAFSNVIYKLPCWMGQ